MYRYDEILFLFVQEVCFYLVYILRKEFIRCESVKSQICRVCSDLTKLADGWKWNGLAKWQNITIVAFKYCPGCV